MYIYTYIVQKRKLETSGFCRLPKPGFRGWQHVRVFPGPWFFKTRVAIPIDYAVNQENALQTPSLQQSENRQAEATNSILQSMYRKFR